MKLKNILIVVKDIEKSKEFYHKLFGLETILDNDGNMIPMYNLERTICDLMRSRSSIEAQDFNSILKTYVSRRDKNLNRLMEYAKLFRVDNVIRKYMGVLL